MHKIMIILTVDKSKTAGAKGEIRADAKVGNKSYGRIYPFGGKCPPFNRMFQMVVHSMRIFLQREADWD